jgi:hypothetical protein
MGYGPQIDAESLSVDKFRSRSRQIATDMAGWQGIGLGHTFGMDKYSLSLSPSVVILREDLGSVCDHEKTWAMSASMR